MTDIKITIERELELIDGMIEVQLHHAEQCDHIANRTMAEKQKGWDMERVALLRKMRAALAAQPATVPCNQHPDAPHGFDRNESHSLDRYVCECEGWTPAQPDNEWREAIEDELVCCHIGTADSFPDARSALKNLIDWHVAVSLDPAVSSDAQALIDRGRAQPVEPVAWLHIQGNHTEPSLWRLDADEITRGWTEVPLYAALPAPAAVLPAEPVARDAALNTLAQVFHNGEEAEGDDGAVMMVDLALWNEGCEALESLVSEDELVAPPAPVPPEPIADEMDAVAIKYARKMALDLECILAEYGGSWYNTAMQTLGEYRSAMNAIPERESPTFMGEPVTAAGDKP